LKCPLVFQILASDTGQEARIKGEHFRKLCERIIQNIASKVSDSNYYKIGDGYIHISAGIGSAQVFRSNLCRRLSEAFANLKWLKENEGRLESQFKFETSEFEAYEKLYLDLRNLNIQEAAEIQKPYMLTKDFLDHLNNATSKANPPDASEIA